MEKDYQLIKKELEKVEKANLGEVILFDLNDHTMLTGLLPQHGGENYRVLFHAMLGIYDGINPLGKFHQEEDGGKIITQLRRKSNFELALLYRDGVESPFTRIPNWEDCMVIEERAFIGPAEISLYLSDHGRGHFDRFLRTYLEALRSVD